MTTAFRIQSSPISGHSDVDPLGWASRDSRPRCETEASSAAEAADCGRGRGRPPRFGQRSERLALIRERKCAPLSLGRSQRAGGRWLCAAHMPGAPHFLVGDGSVRFVSQNICPQVFQDLANRKSFERSLSISKPVILSVLALGLPGDPWVIVLWGGGYGGYSRIADDRRRRFRVQRFRATTRRGIAECPRRGSLTLIEVLVVMMVIVVPVRFSALPAVQQGRKERGRYSCRNNLMQDRLSLRSYESTFDAPAAGVGRCQPADQERLGGGYHVGWMVHPTAPGSDVTLQAIRFFDERLRSAERKYA